MFSTIHLSKNLWYILLLGICTFLLTMAEGDYLYIKIAIVFLSFLMILLIVLQIVKR